MTSVERVVAKKYLGETDEPWRYWLTRPIKERVDAVEQLRCEHHGWVRGTEPRLQRVFTIVRQP